MVSDIIKNSEGWYWPSKDGGGDFEGPSSCWYYMKTHHNVPQKISEYVKERKVIVQAGGNCGYYVKQYASLFNFIYTFEPDPHNFYCLNLNVTETNVLKYQACIGDKHEGVALGNFMKDIGASHVSGPGIIPTFLIDDLSLENCSLIHLDIEGYELHALKGAVKTIEKFRPVIALEFFERWAKRYNTTMNDVNNFLQQLGYTFVHDEQGDRIYLPG